MLSFSAWVEIIAALLMWAEQPHFLRKTTSCLFKLFSWSRHQGLIALSIPRATFAPAILLGTVAASSLAARARERTSTCEPSSGQPASASLKGFSPPPSQLLTAPKSLLPTLPFSIL